MCEPRQVVEQMGLADTAAVEAVDGEDAEPEDEASTGPAAGTATVSIDGTTWEAVASIQCLEAGGRMGFLGEAVDDPQVIITLDAGDPEGEAQVNQNDSGPHNWRAGGVLENTTLGTEVVDGVATGSGTFEDLGSPGTLAEGEFEFRC